MTAVRKEIGSRALRECITSCAASHRFSTVEEELRLRWIYRFNDARTTSVEALIHNSLRVRERIRAIDTQQPARVFSKMHFSKMHFSKMQFSKMHFSKMHFSKILQIFGGLVLGCIKTKFCKKICVRQHVSRSTRFASFCTAAISKFSQKISWKKQQFS